MIVYYETYEKLEAADHDRKQKEIPRVYHDEIRQMQKQIDTVTAAVSAI